MLIEKGIVAALVAASPGAAYYTAPTTLKKAIIKSLSFCNTDTTPQSVTIYLVPSGGSAGAANTLVSARSLLAGESWCCQEAENKVLAAGDALTCLASTASKISVQSTILEHSY